MRSIAEDKFETIGRLIDESSGIIDEQLRKWEREFENDRKSSETEGRRKEYHYNQGTGFQSDESPVDSQLNNDLQLFGLVPPSSLDEVRQVRNRELKKFHPDKYTDQPEKLETAKQIVQIYNTAYDRLKQHYNTKM